MELARTDLKAHTAEADLARALLTPRAVRERTRRLYELGLADKLQHFTVHPERIKATADVVLETTLANYPTLDVPFHSRWRHFCAGSYDRWGTIERTIAWKHPHVRARAAFDLAIISVLLDAGAGPDWSYHEAASDESYARSEGLAVASFDMFVAGAFSTHDKRMLRADAPALSQMTVETLAAGFQVSEKNPLLAVEGRAALLRRLGDVVSANPAVFALRDTPRPGGLYDYLAAQARGGQLPAPAILEAVLLHLGPIWPSRFSLGGVDLGDTWTHPLLATDDATTTLVPLHKLSQWLSYSLIEPLQIAGLTITDIDGLTGLAEYRNGGLFLDMGVIALRDPEEASRPQLPGSTLVVEWRALTVALLDEVAKSIRSSLNMSAERLPLAKVLEGGTWAAGRRIATMKRQGGAPPLSIISDGTVF